MAKQKEPIKSDLKYNVVQKVATKIAAHALKHHKDTVVGLILSNGNSSDQQPEDLTDVFFVGKSPKVGAFSQIALMMAGNYVVELNKTTESRTTIVGVYIIPNQESSYIDTLTDPLMRSLLIPIIKNSPIKSALLLQGEIVEGPQIKTNLYKVTTNAKCDLIPTGPSVQLFDLFLSPTEFMRVGDLESHLDGDATADPTGSNLTILSDKYKKEDMITIIENYIR